MPRVIQDSDDEGDLSEASPTRKEVDQATMAPPRTSEKPTSASATPAIGTSSSEIQREMNAALEGILDPTPSRSGKRLRASDDGNLNLSTTDSSPSKKLKRTKTTATGTRDSPSIFATSPPSKRKIQTYGKNRSSLAEQDVFAEEQSIKNVKSARLGRIGAEVPLDQIVYAQAAPTVNPIDTLHHKPPEPSPLDSSAFVSPTNVSDPFTQQMFTQPSQQLPPHHGMGEGFEDHVPHLMFPELSSTIANSSSSIEKRVASPILSRSNKGTANDKLQNGTPKDTQNHHEHMEQMKDAGYAPSPLKQGTAVFDGEASTAAVNETSTAKSTTKKRRRTDAAYDETAEEADEVIKAPKIMRSHPSFPATIDPDDIIGLPKENYKPRPSRSRSALLPEESTQASTSSTGKLKRLKRSKTTDGMSKATTDKLVDMGFSASQSEAALIKENWVFEKALDMLVRERSATKSPELAKTFAAAESVKLLQPQFQESVDKPEESKLDRAESVTAEKADAGKAFSPFVEIMVPRVDGSLVGHARDETTQDKQHEVSGSTEQSAEKPGHSEQSPPSNTKIKRTKSTKGRGRPKKSDLIVGAEDEEDVLQKDELSPATKAIVDDNVKDLAGAWKQDTSSEKPPSETQQEKQEPIKAEPPPKAPTKIVLNTTKPSQAAEIIELDDDSDDDPSPPKSAKLRRTKTAPASALKKEKKKRGRPKKEKAEKVMIEAPVPKEDANNVVEKVQKEPAATVGKDVLQSLDQNAKVVEWLEKPVDGEASDLHKPDETVEPEGTKRGKAAGKKLDREEAAKPASDDDGDDDDDQVQTQAQKRKKTKVAAKTTEIPCDETTKATADDEDHDHEEGVAPKKTKKGKASSKKTAAPRSAERIADSDVEDDEDEGSQSKTPAKSKTATKKAASREETPFTEHDDEDEEEPPTKKSKKTKAAPKKVAAMREEPPKSVAENETPEPKKADDAAKDSSADKENAKADKKKEKVGAHSPIKKAPVRFRVGLSKRTRIEPLLKIKGR